MSIYYMKHSTIEFSSVNPSQVSYYEEILKHTTLEQIKLNQIEGRHALLLNMGLAGYCPLFDEYFRMRAKKQEYYNQFIEPYLKLSIYTFEVPNALTKAQAKLLESYGWFI